MDFIEGLPSCGRKLTVFVVVDILTKYAHCIALAHPYTVDKVAQVFCTKIFRLHGLPKSIVRS